MKKVMVGMAVCVVAGVAMAQSYSYGGAQRRAEPQKYSYEAQSSHVGLQRGVTTPFMLAFFDPVQAPSSDWDVAGLRLSIFYGNCNTLKGIDIGLVNESNHMEGIQVGLVNVGGDAVGLRVNGLFGDANLMKGLDIGIINSCNTLQGWQIGVINTAKMMKGLQIGVVNHTVSALGVQIGLINIIEDKDFPFMPIFNMSF